MYIIECSDTFCKKMFYKSMPYNGSESTWSDNDTFSYTKKINLAKCYKTLSDVKEDAENVSSAGANVKVWEIKKIETRIDDGVPKIRIQKLGKSPILEYPANYHKGTTLNYLLPCRVYSVLDNLDNNGYPIKDYFDKINIGDYFSHNGIQYAGYFRGIILEQCITSADTYKNIVFKPISKPLISSNSVGRSKDKLCLDHKVIENKVREDLRNYFSKYNYNYKYRFI